MTVALVGVGTGYQGTAVAAFADGSSREVTIEAAWASSNPAVASVSPTGQVTPVAPGSAEIRATFQSIVGAAALTVVTPPRPQPPSPTYTVSGSFRDALDMQSVSDPDVCCLVELTTQSGDSRKIQYSRDTYTFRDVPAGNLQINVTPYLGYSGQSRSVTLSGNILLDFALIPLPVRVLGFLLDARTEARAPRCTARIEAIDGPDAGRATSPTPGGLTESQPNFEFSTLFQPGTVTFRYSAAGGYETKERSIRLRGLEPGNSIRADASLACPGCSAWASMTCP